ncbi:MAG: lysophospholipid acyltransferase family protein [Myxococcota bacterium]
MSLLLAILVWFLDRIPERALGLAARLLRLFWFDLFRYRRRVILENLAQAFPEKTAAERQALARRAAQHLSLTLLETLRIGREIQLGLGRNVRVIGFEHLLAAARSGRGVIVVGAHYGSFELVSGVLCHQLKDVIRCALVVKSFSPAFDRTLTKLRQVTGLEIIRGDDRSAAKEILKMLREGQLVTFVIDQNATRKQGIFVDFFGKPASTMTAAAVFAVRSKAAVIPAYVWREGPNQHVFEALPEFDETPPEGADPVAWRTARWTQLIEAQIRRQPEQWLWTHRRWKTRPLPLSTRTSSAPDAE